MGAISAKEVKRLQHESETLGPKCREMMKGFEERLEHTLCKEGTQESIFQRNAVLESCGGCG